MGKNSAIGVLSFSVANRRRDFLLPSVAPSASLVWQRPASWFNSTPRFLAAQRSAVSSLGEEVAQREPLKGFPLDSFGNKRVAAALLRSREFQICIAFPMGQSSTYFGSTLFLACKYPLVCKKSDDFPAEQQIWKTCPPQGIFALQKSLRGGLRWGTGPSSQRGKPPRKEISRGNLLCAESGLPSLSYPRLQSVQKYAVRSTGTTIRTGQRRGARGAAAPLFRKESRGKPFEGFPLGNFFAAARPRASLRS